jgi:hypothetical protein
MRVNHGQTSALKKRPKSWADGTALKIARVKKIEEGSG